VGKGRAAEANSPGRSKRGRGRQGGAQTESQGTARTHKLSSQQKNFLPPPSKDKGSGPAGKWGVGKSKGCSPNRGPETGGTGSFWHIKLGTMGGIEPWFPKKGGKRGHRESRPHHKNNNQGCIKRSDNGSVKKNKGIHQEP